jgi:hypothetical protein
VSTAMGISVCLIAVFLFSLFIHLIFERESHNEEQAGFKLAIFLPELS